MSLFEFVNNNKKITDFKSLDASIQKESEVKLTSDIVIGDDETDNYRDGIEINKDNVIIDGKGYSIDGNEKSRAFLINAKEVVLKNILFKNCFNRGGGSIFVSQNANLTIADCTFYDNHADDAAAILNMGELKIENCSFKENSAARVGVIGSIPHSDLLINNCLFENNKSYENGGVMVIQGNLKITDSKFKENNSPYGGVIINQGYMDIFTSEFSNNNASKQAGVIDNTRWGKLSISDCKFVKNSSKRAGAILNLGTLMLSGSAFESNHSDEMGGAIQNVGELTHNNCRFIDNAPDDIYGDK